MRILLVDDQPMIGEAVRRALTQEPGVEFCYCQEPAAAIPMALEFQPTVILQDLVMPEVSGLQLLRFFRAHQQMKEVPMVMLSSREEGRLKAEAFRLGANDYIVKLPETVELLARLRYHSRSYLNAQERSRYLLALEAEQERSQQLLLNVLPRKIADQLMIGGPVEPESFESVSVLFADIVGFTKLSSEISAIDLVSTLNIIFKAFDGLVERHGLEKIKTIGDAYMVVAGVPIPREDHGCRIAQMALDMRLELERLNPTLPKPVSLRIGIASGPVVAGIIGSKKFIYDLWGDTVNMASRMESHGLPNQIQVTEPTYRLLAERFNCVYRGVVSVKGKGEMETYWLEPLMLEDVEGV